MFYELQASTNHLCKRKSLNNLSLWGTQWEEEWTSSPTRWFWEASRTTSMRSDDADACSSLLVAHLTTVLLPPDSCWRSWQSCPSWLILPVTSWTEVLRSSGTMSVSSSVSQVWKTLFFVLWLGPLVNILSFWKYAFWWQCSIWRYFHLSFNLNISMWYCQEWKLENCPVCRKP